MKTLAIVLTGCFAAGGALAQTALDTTKSHPVASPNKTQFSTLAAASQKPGGGGGAGGANTSTAPISVFDATGKNVGRLLSTDFMLMPYAGDVMAVPLVGPRVATGSARIAWRTTDVAILYASSDCSGTGYGGGPSAGTRYSGVASQDPSGQFMLVSDMFNPEQVTIASMWANNAGTWMCSALADQSPGMFSPIVATLPLSSVATPPFSVR